MDQASNARFDRVDQLTKVQEGLLPGEEVYAVYDGKGIGTGFIGLTNKRVVLQDNSFSNSTTAVTSLPYRQIQSVSFTSDKKRWQLARKESTVAIQVGGRTYEVEFFGVDKARHAHDTILHFIMS